MTSVRRSGLVSIVTPTLDAALFLREAADSVLAQEYPDIEYIIVDGGSSDDTLTIARALDGRASVYSKPGLNQAQAVNFALQHSHGEFVGFLNADDSLLPNAVSSAVALLRQSPEAPYAYGDAIHIDSGGREIAPYPTLPFSKESLARECFICQPATLLRADAFLGVGGLDTDLHTAFDYDLWIRMSDVFPPPVKADAIWARSRMHQANKSLRDRDVVYSEVIAMMRKHYGYVPFNWLHAYAGYLIEGKDYFFSHPSGSVKRTGLTLLLGLKANRGHRLAFAGEFAREVFRLTGRNTRTRA